MSENDIGDPWPRTRQILGTASTLNQLYELPAETVFRALASVRQELTETGVDEAYRMAAAFGRSQAHQPTTLPDSESALTFTLPGCLHAAAARLIIFDGTTDVDIDSFEVFDQCEGAYGRILGYKDRPGHSFDRFTDSLASHQVSLFSGDRSAFAQVWEIEEWLDPSEVASVFSAAATWFNCLSLINKNRDQPYEVLAILAGEDASLSMIRQLARLWRLTRLETDIASLISGVFLREHPPSWGDAELGAMMVVTEGIKDAVPDCLRWINPDLWSEELQELAAEEFWDDQRKQAEKANRFLTSKAISAELHIVQGDLDKALSLASSFLPGPWEPQRPGEIGSLVAGYLIGRAAGRPSGDESLRLALAQIQQGVGSLQRGQKVQTLHQIAVGERLGEVGQQLDAFAVRATATEDLWLDAVRSLRLTKEALDEASLSKMVADLIDGWRKSAPAREQQQLTAAAQEAVGETAWADLTTNSKDNLLAFFALQPRVEQEPQLARLAGLSLMMAFEKELRLALSRAGLRAEEVENLGRVLSRAYGFPETDNLHRIAAAARKVNLDALRNRAAHGDEFSKHDLPTVADVLVKKGLDNKGLIGLVARYGR